MSNASKPPVGAAPTQAGHLSPPLGVWLTVLICASAIVWLRGFTEFEDANKNIATLIIGFIASMTLLVWFICGSGYARRLRRGTLAVLLVAVAAAAGTLAVDHVDSAMRPVFRWRWQPKKDRLLAPAVAASAPSVDLTATTPHDFPQFLGAKRDCAVEGVELDPDWTAHPPRLEWRRPIGAGWSGFAVVGDHAVTLEQRGEEELATCYSVASGELEWVDAIAGRHEEVLGGVGPRSTPTVFEGRVYALGATGVLRCLDGASGKPLWTKDLNVEFKIGTHEADMAEVAWGRAASPLIVDRMVIVPAGGPPGGPYVSLVAYDVDTGSEIWRGGDQQIGYASASLLTLDGVRQIIALNEACVTGHEVDTGHTLWNQPWPGVSNREANCSQPIALDDHRVLITKGYGGGALLFDVLHSSDAQGSDDWQTKELWHFKRLMQTKFTNVAFYDGYIYGLSDGILECIDPNDGARKWKAGRYGHGQILRVGDLLLVLSETGELALVEAKPQRYTELAKFQALEGKTWNTLALSGPRLLIRNAEEAACYRLPLVEESPEAAR